MEKTQKIERIKYLISILNEANKAYYQEAREIMPNIEYDKLYDELVALEKECNLILSSSPTRNVGFEILSELEKKNMNFLCFLLIKLKMLKI